MVVIVTSVVILLCLRHRRNKPELTDNVAYNTHNHPINTDVNEAYWTVKSYVVATTDPVYATISGSGERGISTSTNEAYISSDGIFT